ncbi:MAG: VOC family protein [Clostridia bacterium]|nr:VOC family protein [Clostridia bacterium]
MRIEHIAMYVNDLKTARAFFVNYFNGKADDGYHNPTTGFSSYFITFDDGARLEIMHKPNLSDDHKALNRTGYIHIAFSVGSRETVDELTQRLRTDGYEVVSGPRTTGDGYYESCVVAVEGNLVEITI